MKTRHEDGKPLLDGKTKDGKGKGKGVGKKGVAKIVSKAIDKLLKEDLPGLLENTVKPIREKLDAKPPKDDVKPPKDDKKVTTPEENAEILKLRTQVETLSGQLGGLKKEGDDAKAAAAKADQENQIRQAMSGYRFSNEDASAAAYKLISLEVSRDKDGKLLGGGNLPLKDFVTEVLKKHDYFLAPVDLTGADAKPGITRGSNELQLEDIKEGMTEEQRTAAFQHLGRVWAASQQS